MSFSWIADMQRVVLAILYIRGLIITTLHDTSHPPNTSPASMQRPGICLITKPFSHAHFLLRSPSLFHSASGGGNTKTCIASQTAQIFIIPQHEQWCKSKAQMGWSSEQCRAPKLHHAYFRPFERLQTVVHPLSFLF